MNEEIKKLIVKSNINIRGCYDETGNTPKELEELTMLVVRECAELFYLDEKSEATGLYIGNMIYKHFGMKR